MNIEFLRAFARRIAAQGRISANDVADIRNHQFDSDEAADGLALAAALFAIDESAKDRCDAWSAFFCDAIVDILVWDERPTGTVTREHADWLLGRIGKDGVAAPLRHRPLLVAIVREAQVCDPRLAAAAFGYGDAPGARSPVARTLGWIDAAGLSG